MIERFLNLAPERQKYHELEIQFREALLKSGAQSLQVVTQALVDQFDASFQASPTQRFAGRRPLQLQGIIGFMQIQRDYYFDGERGHCPADSALALEGSYTPGLARMMCRAAAKSPYEEASLDLFDYAAVKVPPSQIQRLALQVAPAVGPWLKTQASKPESAFMYISGDGTGAPMRKECLEGRAGKQADGSSKTREVKLGCVFLQTEVDPEGHPIRKEDSTSYIGTFEPAAEFGLLLRQEAQRRGMARATQIIFIGDGAAWIWELARINFAGAILILDFYHAAQHLIALVDALVGKETPEGKKKIKLWKGWLLKDKAAQILKQAKAGLERSLDKEQAGKDIAYLEHNLERMSYGTFRKAGYFIGSGVIEAGCKTVVGKRMKASGMFWSEAGGQAILDLRCAFLSDRLDIFFKDRAATHAAENEPLKMAA